MGDWSIMEQFLEWETAVWVVAIGVCFVAGAIRGITGFGFPLIVISGLNLVALPVEVVPLATGIDLVLGIGMIPQIWREVHWTGARWLWLGAVIGIPVGISVLILLDPDIMRIGISVAVLISVILIARGFALGAVPGRGLILVTGGASGFLSGAGGIPGPPVILLYLSSPLPISTTRATTSVFFILVDMIALAGWASQGLIDDTTVSRAAVLIPIAFLGMLLGYRLYGIATPAQVKNLALGLLMVLAIVGIGKVLIS